MKLKSALIAFCVTSTLAGVALAQEPAWLPDRQFREGPGFLAGNFELHPGIGADFGYDSNYLHRPSDDGPIGSLRLRISPAFSVATLGPQRRADGAQPSVGFRFELGATYNEFIPVSGGRDAGGDGGAADRKSIAGQRNIDGFARANLDILPGRTWSGRIAAGVTRAIRPVTEPTTGSFASGSTFDRWIPGAAAEIAWMPGSGLLDWRLGYEFSGTFFQSSDFGALNSFRNDAVTRGRWRFLPRTAMIFDGRFGFITYPSTSLGKTSSHPMRARIGMSGLFTPSFGILAMVGWGASFYTKDPQDFNSVIGQAELRWYLQPTGTTDPMKVNPLLSGIAVGFVRDFEDSFIGTYHEKDQGYVSFNYLAGGSFLINANVAAGAVIYPAQGNGSAEIPTYGQPGGWSDVRVDGKLFIEYRVKDWLGINAEADYIGYFSKTQLHFPSDPTKAQSIGYQQIAAFGGLRAFW